MLHILSFLNDVFGICSPLRTLLFSEHIKVATVASTPCEPILR